MGEYLSGSEISEYIIELIRENPISCLIDYLTCSDEEVRRGAVHSYSAISAEFISRIESQRELVAKASFELRKKAYGARMIIDEIDNILKIARGLGLGWSTPGDAGAPLMSIVTDVPIFNIERELVVRLEDQRRAISENDLRDMMSFITVLPFADVVVAEKQFVNLSLQAGLDKRYETKLLTSILRLSD